MSVSSTGFYPLSDSEGSSRMGWRCSVLISRATGSLPGRGTHPRGKSQHGVSFTPGCGIIAGMRFDSRIRARPKDLRYGNFSSRGTMVQGPRTNRRACWTITLAWCDEGQIPTRYRGRGTNCPADLMVETSIRRVGSGTTKKGARSGGQGGVPSTAKSARLERRGSHMGSTPANYQLHHT